MTPLKSVHLSEYADIRQYPNRVLTRAISQPSPKGNPDLRVDWKRRLVWVDDVRFLPLDMVTNAELLEPDGAEETPPVLAAVAGAKR